MSIKQLCEQAGMSRKNYYKERKKRMVRQIEEQKVLSLVRREWRDQPRLGGRKLYHMLQAELRAQGVELGRDRMFGILRDNGLLVEPRRRSARTTCSRHNLPIFRNLVKDREATSVNQIWNADLTYLQVGQGFMCLALISDQHSRKIVGYHCSDNPESVGCQQALKMALRGLDGSQRPIHHSDHGCQYCCHQYVGQLQRAGLSTSMTEQNHCYENAYAERLNGILKDEYGLGEWLANQKQALRCVEQAVWQYNHRRPHMRLNLPNPPSSQCTGSLSTGQLRRAVIHTRCSDE